MVAARGLDLSAAAPPAGSLEPVEVPRRERLLLGAILAVAVGVRAVGLDFGTPLLHCRPDERTILNLVLRFGSGDLNPHSFNYGTLWLYVLAVAYGVYFALGWAVGWFSAPRDLLRLYDFDPTSLLRIARGLSVAMGTATVLLAAQAGRALLGRAEGLIAGALLGLTYLHVRDSHFGTTDVPMTAFLTASLLFLARALRSGGLRDLALAGLCAGLAASIKYAGALMFVPAAWTLACRAREEGATLAPDRRALAFAALFALGFLAGTPFALLDAPQFVADVLAESRHLAEGHHVALPRGIVQHPRVSLLYGMGAPLLASAVLGALVLALRRPREAGVLLAFPLAYFALLAPARTVFVRYAVPLLPFLCIAAAFALAELGRALAARSWPRSAPAWCALLCVAVLAPGVQRIAQLDALLRERDNRLVVQDWIEANLPPGSTLHQAVPGELFYGPQWARVDLFPTPEMLERDLAALVARGRAERRMRVLIEELRARGRAGFVEVGFEPGRARFVSLLREPVEPPRYVLIARHPVRRLPAPPAELLAVLERDYALLRSFEVVPLQGSAVYDEQDAFFVPFAGFEGVERPGPSYWLYERRAPGGGALGPL
jgi:hypothetical protein